MPRCDDCVPASPLPPPPATAAAGNTEALYYALVRKRARLAKSAEHAATALPAFDAQWADWLRAAETGEGLFTRAPSAAGAFGSAAGSARGGVRAVWAAGGRGGGAGGPSAAAASADAQLDALLAEMRAMGGGGGGKPAPQGVADAEASAADGSAAGGFAIDPRNLGSASGDGSGGGKGSA
jgi:hypothetical protein